MYFDIDLNATPPTVALADADNFRAFQIEATGPADRLGEAIAPYGRWDGEHAWFDPEKVKQLAGERARSEDWQQGFAGLSAYAAEHGYTGEDGSLRAHVEWRE